jgi:ribosomal protein S12 methylthiotransferase
VAGCLSQRYGTELAQEMPEVDHFLGSADMLGLSKVLGGAGKRLGVSELGKRAYLYDHTTPRQLTGSPHSAYVKIAEGCDRPCAFCIIPKLRGPQRSRAIDSVVAEAEALAGEGTREINLIAQDLTRYGADLPQPRPTLAQLLRRVARVDGIDWVRLHYTYPTAFTDELIEVIANEPSVVKYIDVPLQHIDDHMLKTMRRGHSARITHELIERLRSRIDGLVLRSTFIVGHPGETDESFARLCEFIESSELERVGVFTYSPEPGTVSATLGEPVDTGLAEERRDRLMELQRAISLRKNRALIGTEIEVLVDGVSRESDLLLEGRWYGQAPEIDGTVILTDGTARAGELVRAVVTDASDYDLVASLELGTVVPG